MSSYAERSNFPKVPIIPRNHDLSHKSQLPCHFTKSLIRQSPERHRRDPKRQPSPRGLGNLSTYKWVSAVGAAPNPDFY